MLSAEMEPSSAHQLPAFRTLPTRVRTDEEATQEVFDCIQRFDVDHSSWMTAGANGTHPITSRDAEDQRSSGHRAASGFSGAVTELVCNMLADAANRPSATQVICSPAVQSIKCETSEVEQDMMLEKAILHAQKQQQDDTHDGRALLNTALCAGPDQAGTGQRRHTIQTSNLHRNGGSPQSEEGLEITGGAEKVGSVEAMASLGLAVGLAVGGATGGAVSVAMAMGYMAAANVPAKGLSRQGHDEEDGKEGWEGAGCDEAA